MFGLVRFVRRQAHRGRAALQVLALPALLAITAAAAPPQDDVLAQMRALEVVRGTAIRTGDMAALERLYAPDFSGVTAAGTQVTRADLFKIFTRAVPPTPTSGPSVSSEILTAVAQGDVVVATGRLRIGESESLFMHVFRWRTDHWEMFAGAACPVAAR